MMGVALGCVRMVRRAMMVAVFVMLGCFPMVPGGVIVVLSRQTVMLRCLSGHSSSSPFVSTAGAHTTPIPVNGL
jgi:hypothetical protein